nr:uncharacterized protein LOC123279099 isoform X1 [Equus asinus]
MLPSTVSPWWAASPGAGCGSLRDRHALFCEETETDQSLRCPAWCPKEACCCSPEDAQRRLRILAWLLDHSVQAEWLKWTSVLGSPSSSRSCPSHPPVLRGLTPAPGSCWTSSPALSVMKGLTPAATVTISLGQIKVGSLVGAAAPTE